MTALIWMGLRAFLFSLILTPIIRDVFSALHIVDQPDGTRKLHRYAIPRVGGIAVAISYFVSYYLASLQPGGLTATQTSLAVSLLPPATVVFVIGLIDDFVGLRPWQKLAGQLAAACMAYWAGVRILSVAGHATGDWWSFLATVLWLLACTNAFNLVDGLDGLAAGIGFLATCTIFTAAALQHNAALAAATLPLAGCLMAFLCYNFSPATIFLGDCGSLLIGFLLGCYGVIWTQKSLTALGVTAPLIALSLPLIDVLLAVARRVLRRQPIFGADRGHIHHRLIDRGLHPRRAVLVIYGVCAIAAAFSLLQSSAGSLYIALPVGGLFVLAAWIFIRRLGYSEFILAGRFLRLGAFQRILSAQLALDSLTTALSAAETIEDWWLAIRLHYSKLGFSAVHVHLDGAAYREWPAHVAGPEYWSIRIPLSGTEFIEMAHEFRSDEMPSAVAQAADLLRDSFSERLKEKARRPAARSAAAS
jgi:UDP-GlcNAc:undecaprenyl-phosphate GlcNAc-1-phosphate transferase